MKCTFKFFIEVFVFTPICMYTCPVISLRKSLIVPLHTYAIFLPSCKILHRFSMNSPIPDSFRFSILLTVIPSFERISPHFEKHNFRSINRKKEASHLKYNSCQMHRGGGSIYLPVYSNSLWIHTNISSLRLRVAMPF